MPFTRKNPNCSPEEASGRVSAEGFRNRSGSPDARGRTVDPRAALLIFIMLALIVFLSPETAGAARLAGEKAPVPTATSQPPAPPPPPVQPAERTETPTRTEAAPQQAPAPISTVQGKQYVTMDFDNVDIPVFIKFVSELTGRNFVIDEKVRGKVTVVSPRKIPVDEVYKVFESILDIYGFTTVQAGEVIKVVPSQDARGQNLEVRLKKEAISPEDRVVTQILSLQHANPDEMKKVLDPLITKSSIILA
jgi:hypothetical protein